MDITQATILALQGKLEEDIEISKYLTYDEDERNDLLIKLYKDCNYYLWNSGRKSKLIYNNVDDQIKLMKSLYMSLNDKSRLYFTMDDIKECEKWMKADDITFNYELSKRIENGDSPFWALPFNNHIIEPLLSKYKFDKVTITYYDTGIRRHIDEEYNNITYYDIEHLNQKILDDSSEPDITEATINIYDKNLDNGEKLNIDLNHLYRISANTILEQRLYYEILYHQNH